MLISTKRSGLGVSHHGDSVVPAACLLVCRLLRGLPSMIRTGVSPIRRLLWGSRGWSTELLHFRQPMPLLSTSLNLQISENLNILLAVECCLLVATDISNRRLVAPQFRSILPRLMLVALLGGSWRQQCNT